MPESEERHRKRKYAKKVPFEMIEDERLVALVKTFGENNWPVIACRMPGGNVRQCRERYSNYIDPKLMVGGWTKSEDIRLIQMVAEHGHRWRKIATLFGNRSSHTLSCRYNELNQESLINQKNEMRMDIVDEQVSKEIQAARRATHDLSSLSFPWASDGL